MRRQAKLATYFGVIALIFLVLQLLLASQLEIEDAVYLTKNSLRQFQIQYLCKNRRIGCLVEPGETPQDDEAVLARPLRHLVGGFDLDLDFPFSNVVNSVFPIDLVVSYNVSNTTHSFAARYASFSPVLNGKLTSRFAIVDGYGCSTLNATTHPHYKDKILIVLRGECTFVKKVANLVNLDLSPRAVIVANNEPYRNLITMYSSTFNEDGSLTVPILFISNEDYKELQKIEKKEVSLSIETTLIDNWINLMLSMAVSPPLLIVLFYLLMRGIQLCHRRRISTMNLKLVRKMAVYIYNQNHLVPASNFYEYLALTGQTGDIPLVVSLLEDLANADDTTDLEIAPPSNLLVINGTDLYSLQKLHLLFAKRDYYPTLKCSICLDRFVPLRSRVLVLECKHIYHETCLLNWLINFRRTCPLCNESLKLVETLPLLSAENNSYTTFGADLERGLTSHPWLQNSAWGDRNNETSSTSLAANSSQSYLEQSLPTRKKPLQFVREFGPSSSRMYQQGSQSSQMSGLQHSLGPSNLLGTSKLQSNSDYETNNSQSHELDNQKTRNLKPIVVLGSRSGSSSSHTAGQSVDSDASFVTTKSQLSEISNYLTPHQTIEEENTGFNILGADDTQLSDLSDTTIMNTR